VTELRARLAEGVSPAEGALLAARIRERLGAEAVQSGTGQALDGLDVMWAIEAVDASSPPLVVAELGADFRLPMQRLGNTPVFAASARWDEGTAVRWRVEVDGQPIGTGQSEVYTPHPDLVAKPGVPSGTLLACDPWRSQVFGGTVRDWSIYVPADTDGPAAVMVFQDGVRFYQSFVPTAFDNLIAAGDMPPTIGVFVDPGVFADTTVSNRSFEYDTLSDQYARFLLDE
jgi:enterochelin esterase family protein